MTGSASAARLSLDPLTGTTPRRLARVAGALYLVNIVLGAFAIGLVPGMLFVSDDLAKTAHNIQTHETLYRLSLAAHVVVTLTNVPMALLFYELFKIVNRRLALLDVFFTLVATAVEIATIPNEFTPLALLHGKAYTGALSTAQMQALQHLPSDLSSVDYSIYGLFYGFDILCLAYLVRRSTFMPTFISTLLAIDSLAYLVSGFTTMIAPGVASHLSPWIQLPAPIGEGTLSLWLLIAGVDSERWRRRASEASAAWSTA